MAGLLQQPAVDGNTPVPEGQSEHVLPTQSLEADSGSITDSRGHPEPLQGDESEPSTMEQPAGTGAVPGNKFLLIDTNEESVRDEVLETARKAIAQEPTGRFQRPRALRADLNLHPHQQAGIHARCFF